MRRPIVSKLSPVLYQERCIPILVALRPYMPALAQKNAPRFQARSVSETRSRPRHGGARCESKARPKGGAVHFAPNAPFGTAPQTDDSRHPTLVESFPAFSARR